jgi:transcriptional regulator with GAF, ATPase, and Fis domain
MRVDQNDEMAALSDVARQVEAHALSRWGAARPMKLIGHSAAFVRALDRVARYAPSNGTVLLCGETGTGKELFARAVHMLSPRRTGPWVCVNCAQYQDAQLSVSELFGHRRGSFTGAVADQRGVFEAAHGGVLFLDEIGDLPAAAQALLLRALNDGEIVPLGESRAQRVDVRLVAATNRNLKSLVDQGTFRADLYFRLRCLQVAVPAIREREEDWQLLLTYFLADLNRRAARPKAFSRNALSILGAYAWPGNARELRALVETGFYSCEADVIESSHFVEALEQSTRVDQLRRIPLVADASSKFERMVKGETNFWEAVYRPFLDRELNRAEVQELLAQGLAWSSGSYKGLLAAFGVAPTDYLRFMDFLRHHRLKPQRSQQSVPAPLEERHAYQ